MKMIKNAMTALVSIAAVVAMTACSSDSDSPIVSGKLATGGFLKYIGDDPATSTYSALIDAASNQRWQYLYAPSEIQGSGIIKTVSFIYESDESAEVICPDLSIKMGHTSLTDLTDTFANNVEQGAGSMESVRAADPLTYPVGSLGDI